MQYRKLAFSLLVLGLMHQVVGDEETESTIICRIQAYYVGDGNFYWRQATNATQLPPEKVEEIRTYSVCCPGYVYFKASPSCDHMCPSGSCIYGYCPPDDDKVNCKCYDDDTYPGEDTECIPVCTPGQDTEWICHPGYTKDARTNLCVPTECYNRCSNGKCDQMGTCTCDEKFAKHTNRTGMCVPQDCVDNCHNGWCSDDGKCNCDKGFKNLDDQTCERVVCPSVDSVDALYCKSECDAKCKNGTCTEDGSCICSAGYKTDPDDRFSCYEVNCPSSDSEETVFCKSECDSKCTNGVCSDDGICNCNKGHKASPEAPYTCNEIVCPSYDADDSVYCKTECETSCTNGVCSDEGACNCASGFKSSPEDRFTCNEIICPSSDSDDVDFCRADCESKCITGLCNVDGSCSCLARYKKNPDDHFVCSQIRCPATDSEDNEFCKAQCESICVNGNCSDEGSCNCAAEA